MDVVSCFSEEITYSFFGGGSMFLSRSLFLGVSFVLFVILSLV